MIVTKRKKILHRSKDKLNFDYKVLELVKLGHTTPEKVWDVLGINVKIEKILEVFTSRKEDIDEIINKGVGFSHKKEAYFTEEEMIRGYVAPCYTELSDSEKELYHMEECP
jgi:hypothetical protein